MNTNYFQKVLLPLHIKLQGLYREKCGDWQVGDGVVIPPVPHIQYLVRSEIENDYSLWNQRHKHSAIRIPRTIDDSSEEARRRSLVGMLNQKGKEWIIARFNMEYLPFNNRFTEAILRALLAQEGIEP